MAPADTSPDAVESAPPETLLSDDASDASMALVTPPAATASGVPCPLPVSPPPEPTETVELTVVHCAPVPV